MRLLPIKYSILQPPTPYTTIILTQDDDKGQNQEEEECQEGYTILDDGVWCKRHRYDEPGRSATRAILSCRRQNNFRQHTMREARART